jgi:DNA-binding NarL/FixJ family response regulator
LTRASRWPTVVACPVTLLIADPYRLTLESIRETLEAADHLEVVGEALSAADLLATLKVKRPDVVLLDLDLPDMEGLACLGLIRENHPTVKVVMLAAEREPARIEAALRGGAIACVLKSVEPADLASAVRQAVQETVYTSVAPEESPPDPVEAAGLTEREVTMLRLLARGLSNKAIGQELWVTEQTVKFHMNNLYRKLGVPNRTAAARFAYANGLTGEG